MPPRLSHHKSRLGCNRCRARKVKCDEVHPRCGACARHAVSCEYPPFPARSLPDTSSRVKHKRTADQDQPMLDVGNCPPINYRNGQSPAKFVDARNEMLELQLMHEWVAYVCESICTTWRFWRYQAPVLAFKHRPFLDAMLALSALYASRQMPRHWVTVEGRMVSVDDGRINSMPLPDSALKAGEEWKGVSDNPEYYSASTRSPSRHGDHERDLGTFDSAYMLHVSRVYFDRALEAQSQAVLTLRPENVRATFMCSVLVSYYALFTLSEDDLPAPPSPSAPPPSEPSPAASMSPRSATTASNHHPSIAPSTPSHPDLPPAYDAIQWFRLTHGTGVIVQQWMQFPNGSEWFEDAGAMYGPPDLTDLAAIFAPQNRKPFAYLLSPIDGASSGGGSSGGIAEDLLLPPSSTNSTVPPTATILSAYESALSYIGSIYTNLPLAGGKDTPLATCRRIMALPSCLTGTHFPGLVIDDRAPRALAMLAHVFAMMKLVDDRVPWLKGIADRQVPMLCAMLPDTPGWREMVRWPMAVVRGEGGGLMGSS